MVQVHCDEGVAIRIGPKPCVRGREAADEPSAGERTGQPLSPVMSLSRVPTVSKDRKATRPCAPARAHGRPGGVVDPGMCGSPAEVGVVDGAHDYREPAMTRQPA